MNKVILTLVLYCSLSWVNAQTTYYWIGGAGPVSFTSNGNWNTALNGSGTNRTTAASTDVLIFDGTNIGGTTPTTGAVTCTVGSTTTGQLKLQNNANVVLQRTTAAGGSGTLSVNGDATIANDLEVPFGSSLTVNSPIEDGTINIALLANATGLIGGTITFSNTGAHRITSQTVNGLVFASGSTFNSAGTPTSGYPFGSSSQAVQFGVQFLSGANLIVTGTRGPFGGTSTFQACNMMPNSNYYVRTSNVAGTGAFTNNKIFGNLFIENGSTFTFDGACYKIDNLVINNGCSIITHTSGNTPILGNFTNNGSFDAPLASTNTLLFAGTTTQLVSGTGTINVPNLNIGNTANVVVEKTIQVATSTVINGKINFNATAQITGNATLSARVNTVPLSVTGNTTAGSYVVTNIVGSVSSLTGLSIDGIGIDANTSVVGTSSGSLLIILSKPATSTLVGTTLNFKNDTATIETANVNGLDSTNGSIVVTGTKSYQGGLNYIFNGATQTPFGISSGSTATILKLGTVVINAPITVNRGTQIINKLTINNKLTLRPIDTIQILTGGKIDGNYNSSNYIVTGYNTLTNKQAVIRYDGITSNVLLPIGTVNSYLPFSMNPASITSITATVFEGITTNGALTGPAMSTAAKQLVVDAVWNINRISGAGSADIKLNWPASLEGSTFAINSDAEIGLIENNATTWSSISGIGNNTSNTVIKTTTTYGPFSAGGTQTVIPFVFNPLPNKVYGNPDFSGGASSLNTTQPILYSSSNTSVATIVGGNIKITGAGTTIITASQATDGNYPAASIQQTLNVDKAALVITADDKFKSEGEVNPSFSASYAGFVLGETPSVLSSPVVLATTAVVSSPVGNYPITVSGATANNYNITFVNGTLTVRPKQTQTITFNTLPTKTYGNANFVIGATSSNNTIPITYTSSNTTVALIVGNSIQIVGAGTCTITASQAGNVGYFAAADVSRTLTVNKTTLAIRVVDTVKNQGQENPIFTFVYTGFVNGDTVTNLLSQPNVLTDATISSAPGIYVTTPQAATSNNYDFVYIKGKITIFPPGGSDQQFFNVYASNNSTLNINVFSKQAALGDILLYDNNGRLVAKKNLFIPVGFIGTTLNIAQIPNGVYVIAIKGTNVDLIKKIRIAR